uniref:Uncharacterized protein n=1 Tax=Oryza meridionalis TaxID=40149 RepID=A0A0E0D4W2_9ORYZ
MPGSSRPLNPPNLTEKIMNKAEIFITLLLPTRVKANRPAFSLLKQYKANTCQPTPRAKTEGGQNVAPAYLVTAINVPVD